MKLSSGQTILELLIALAVIAVGLLSAVTLVYNNLGLVERDLDEVTAVNLAREGAELAKVVRDSNWLAGSAFDAGLYDSTDYSATPIWNGVTLTPSFDFTADYFTDQEVDIINYSTSTAPSFFANYNDPAGITGAGTVYKRMLTFHPICDDYTVLDSGAACAPRVKIGVRVESRIEWNRKGKDKNFTIYEDLYDWR